MQNAAEIRDAFFTAGAAPSVSFEMKPYSLDTRAQAVSLDIDGTEVAYQHGGQINPVRVTWPGAVGNSRITLQPPLPASRTPWCGTVLGPGSACSAPPRSAASPPRTSAG
jgi:type VI protein secretion system component VasK